MRQVDLGGGEQRGEPQGVLLRNVCRKERGDRLGLVGCPRSGGYVGELLERKGNAPVLADHLGHRLGQPGAGSGDAVDRLLLGQSVRKDLVGQICDQLGGRGFVRAAGDDDAGQRRYQEPDVLLEDPVVSEHRLEGLGLGVRQRVSPPADLAFGYTSSLH